MTRKNTLCLILNCSFPFLPREPLGRPEQAVFSWEEVRFFEALSETYLPLLAMFERLESSGVPFVLGLAMSPTFCQMCSDEVEIARYLEYLGRQCRFGEQEIARCANDASLSTPQLSLARRYHEAFLRKREDFTGRYNRDILAAFDIWRRKGRVEILATAATHCFLPFYVRYPENLHAQLDVAQSALRGPFPYPLDGFLLPDLAWCAELEPLLLEAGYKYTVLDTHTALLGRPTPEEGSFRPAFSSEGLGFLIRDFYANQDIAGENGFSRNPVYRSRDIDAVTGLSAAQARPFTDAEGRRTPTGYRYCAGGTRTGDVGSAGSRVKGTAAETAFDKEDGTESAPQGRAKPLYNREAAEALASAHAKRFLERRAASFAAASAHLKQKPLSVCAFNADTFGRFWFEGTAFLENLFTAAASSKTLEFTTPGAIFKALSAGKDGAAQTLCPEYSSGGFSGYAESWLDASNDWVYRHQSRAISRMIELTEHFSNANGLRERMLNQAAREILLAENSLWPRLMSDEEFAYYAQERMEVHLRNFTTIYEALGSSHVSTRWLTKLEQRDCIFSDIDYRVFRKRR